MVATSARSPAHVAGPAGCPIDDCDKTNLELVDVFCHDHEQFMPLREMAGVLRTGLLLGWGVAMCWAFVLSAQLESAVPVLLAVATVGLAIVALPLRYFPGPWAAVSLGWALAMLVAVLYSSSLAGRSFAPVLTAVLASALLGWLLRLVTTAFGADPPERPWRRICATVAGLLAAALTGTVFAAVTAGPLHELSLVPSGVHEAILALSGWSAVAALLLAAGAAAVMGLDSVVDRDSGFVPPPQPPRRIVTPRRPARGRVSGPRDPISQMARALSRFAVQVAHGITVTLVMLGNAALAAAYGLRVVLVAVINWAFGWVIGLAVLLTRACLTGLRSAGTATRFVLVPVAGVGAGAWAVTQFARGAERYLVSGDPIQVPVLPAWAVVAACCLAAAWIALCGLPVAVAGRSALRSASASTVWVLLLTATGGWVTGLLGVSGHGPVRVGWFTAGSTAILAIVSVAAAVTRRRARTRTA